MNITEIIKQQYKLRIFEESKLRIYKVLDLLEETQIWYTPNNSANSIGNLILHLCGNVTQWIGSGIGQMEDQRHRDEEFIIKGETKAALKQRLEHLEQLTLPVIDAITEETLQKKLSVQGFNETGLSIIIHVIEHFSYHTGQIALLAKIMKDQDLGFYKDIDLNKKSQ